MYYRRGAARRRCRHYTHYCLHSVFYCTQWSLLSMWTRNTISVVSDYVYYPGSVFHVTFCSIFIRSHMHIRNCEYTAPRLVCIDCPTYVRCAAQCKQEFNLKSSRLMSHHGVRMTSCKAISSVYCFVWICLSSIRQFSSGVYDLVQTTENS